MNTQKIISILFGILAIYLITEFLLDKSDKRLRSFDKTYVLKESLIISDKFKTDFKSSYGIRLDLLNGNYKGMADTIFPLEIDLKILKNGKEIELFGDYKKSYFINNNEAQLASFMSKKNAEYEIEMNIHDAEIERNTKELKLYIETNVPAPSYELYFDREFKWVYQIITGIVILISLITGYFGFRKKASS
ncbi:hypothetical protein M0D21_08090 [Aquimarina sp. D1M17]|uniref:hypothetical protein n=1 Tax=Aquimarina acroporae TaxID=2937283 RepID=UPI0020C0AC3E|nr:hypothetical protein [Aquimarina acroporae]MCK8521524.1 hypothetical protein [Aquimarina acroporae]